MSTALYPDYLSNSYVPGKIGTKTGFFHTEQEQNGTWWIIAPLGRYFLCFGIAIQILQ